MSKRFVAGKIKYREKAFKRRFMVNGKWKGAEPTEEERRLFMGAFNAGWKMCMHHLRHKKVIKSKEEMGKK